jgi:serine/threonine protein kinase
MAYHISATTMSTLNDSLIGKQLDEYRIDKALGVGGMARVYRALDTKLRRYVALKVIAPNFRADAKHTARFEREAQSIARLDHPNIVHIYRFGQVGDLYYIAMQYVEGVDVSWLIEDYRRDGEVMPLPDVARIVTQIGEALDYAHSKGVIHRDVKPGNIMVNNQGRAILTDFGLALLGEVGTQGQIFGSPYYIAPEQAISSGNVVPQSDLYALGVTVFEMLTGELPFSGADAMEIATQHVTEPPPPPSHFNRAIPPALDEVVLHSLEKEPDARYQTGAELSAALQQAIDNWPADNLPATEGVRRPSLVVAPQKVSELLKSAPALPPLPPDDLPEEPPFLPPVAGVTQAARPAEPTSPAVAVPPNYQGDRQPYYPPASDSKRRRWLYPLVFAGALFAVGLIGLLLLLLAIRGGQPVVSAPTPTAAVAATPTTAPTSVMTAPTQSMTATPVILPGGAGPTTAAGQPTAPPQPAIPADRSAPPPGSRRLGEFAVEDYCTSKGYGITLTNNKVDWACINKGNKSIVFVLQPSDFDTICRSWYGNDRAFAIRDQKTDVPAYNWSCYDLPPGAVPTAVPPTTSAGGAVPSAISLVARYGQDWVALVNISSSPLNVESVEFRRPDSTLKAISWGHPVLMPGECLRIFAGDQPPAQLPAKCTSVIDYNAPKAERQRWFDGPVTIAINPSTTYCYPAAKCS